MEMHRLQRKGNLSCTCPCALMVARYTVTITFLIPNYKYEANMTIFSCYSYE